jgi:carboxylesterase
MPGAEPWSSGGGNVGVLVLHGFTGSPIIMRPYAEGLAARGLAIEMPRLPGHGTHWWDLASTRYADWRAEAVQALARLRARCPRVVVAGLSMGGTLALDLVLSQPAELAGAVVINAPYLDRPGARLARLVGWVAPFLPRRLLGMAENDVARAGVDGRSYRLVSTRAGASLVGELARLRARVATVQRPVLVAYSRVDHSVDPASSRALLAALGRHGRELVLERSYHLATLDHDAELLIERTAQFVDEVTAAGDAATMLA